MTKIDNPTDIRKLLLVNGYLPLANIDKRCVLTGWPQLTVDEALIETKEWARGKHQATGLRVDAPLGSIDADIAERTLMERVLDRWIDYLPAVFDGAPLLARGTSASCKLAFFVRLSKPFGRKATRKYRQPGGGDAQQVEIYGGKTPRQFGCFGAHKRADDGTVLSTYAWKCESPLDTPLDQLPELTPEQCDELIRLADAVLKEGGLELVPEKRKAGTKEGEPVYDLDDDMLFVCEDGGTYRLSEFRDAVANEPKGLRCSASWWDDGSENTSRCRARMTANGLMVFDHDTWTKHYEAAHKPPDEADVQAAYEVLQQAAQAEGSTIEDPVDGDPVDLAAAKLRGRYLLWTTAKGSMVIRVTARSMGEAMSLGSFRDKFQRFRLMQGRTVITAVGLWLDRCFCIDDGAMRPDMPSGSYVDQGRQFLNLYYPPVHDAVGGSADIGKAFIEQLAPVEAERKWFLQWLAHKLRNPAIPGPGVINVANDRFGSGRGTLEKLLRRLTGYVKTVSYADFIGSTSQSQYNDWMFDSLFVVVNETQRLEGKTHYAIRHDAYEIIKERLDPEAGPRRLIRKTLANYEAWSFCAYVLNVNSIDAVPLPLHDRRCFVLTNGEPRDPQFWVDVNLWLKDPANIAAFYHYLMTIDLTGYSPYAVPMMTEGKQEMAEAGQSPLDHALDEVLNVLRACGPIFSVKHVIEGMAALERLDREEFPETWKSIVKRGVRRRNVYRVGVRDKQNWHPEFGGERYATYAWTAADAKKWTLEHPATVRMELERVGALDNTFASAFSELQELVRQRTSGPGPDDTLQ